MERPLADKRPVGPIFSQSDEFNREFLGGDSNNTFAKGNSGIIQVTVAEEPRNSSDLIRSIENAVDRLRPYVLLEIYDDGQLNGGDYIMTYSVVEVQDSDVTISQYQSGLLNEIDDPSVIGVNIYNKDTKNAHRS